MKLWKAAGATAIGLAIASRVARRQGGPAASMHEQDWEDGRVPVGGRRYRSPGQLIHHLRELIALQEALLSIYVLRRMDPAFREQVMIVTADANGCPQ